MNKLSAIIVEDEVPAQELIKAYLSSDSDVEIVAVCDDGFEGLKAINTLKPDILFLDIQVPKLTGFEILELLEVNPVVIFSTAYDEYAIKAFNSNAADYLLKPYSKARFNEALQRAKEKHNTSLVKPIEKQVINPELIERIVVKTRSKLELIKRNEIMYLQADDDYVRIFCERGEFMKNDTLKKYENSMGKDFIRVHRSFIVNINFISNVHLMEKESYEVLLQNGTRIKASKSGYKVLKNTLGM